MCAHSLTFPEKEFMCWSGDGSPKSFTSDWSGVSADRIIRIVIFFYISGQHVTLPILVDKTEQLQLARLQHVPENLSPIIWAVSKLVCNLFFLFIAAMHNVSVWWNYTFLCLVDSLKTMEIWLTYVIFIFFFATF